MSRFIDFFLQTLQTLRAHALRFALTSLGIFWGAATLTFLSAETNGNEQSYHRQLERTGPKVVWAFSGVVLKDGLGERGARRLELEWEDVARLDALHIIEEVSRETQLWNRVVRAGNRTRVATVVGMDEAGLRIRNFEPERGRHYDRIESERGERVAFLGHRIARDLFGERPAVGRTIRIDGVPFEVVGTALRKGDQLMYMGDADDALVSIPAQAAERWLSRSDVIDRFMVAPRTRQESAASADSIRMLTSLHHDFEPGDELALNFVNVQEIWQILDTLFTGLKVFLIGTGLVTLLVGAVGVMNIMLVVVGERSQEVGLRKALGATNRAIFLQFLSEAALVSTLAGSAGCAAGFGLLKLTRLTVRRHDAVASLPTVDPETVVIIVVSLIIVGIVSGLVPALRATRIPPAESLRGA